jgi:hypothetical protein
MGLGWPSGRPRWEQRTTEVAPFFKQYSMLGIAPTLRGNRGSGFYFERLGRSK